MTLPILKVIKEHLAAEAARDIEWTLRTVTEDCEYEFPVQNLAICGRDELRRYYAVLFESRPGKTLASKIKRYWLSGDDTVVAECEVTYATPDGPTIAFFIGIFVIRGNTLSAERVYVTEHQQWVSQWRRELLG